MSLILGLLWLYDMGATIDIQKGQLEIGVRSQGEQRQTIQGLAMAMSQRQKLLLAPNTLKILKEYIGFKPGTETIQLESADDVDEDNTDTENETDSLDSEN